MKMIEWEWIITNMNYKYEFKKQMIRLKGNKSK